MVAAKVLCMAALVVAALTTVDAFGGGRRGGRRSSSGSGKGSGKGHRRGGLRAGGFLNRGNNTNATVPVKTNKYTVPKGWAKKKTTYCPYYMRMTTTRYTSFATAQKACAKNSTCTAVMDSACRGKAFYTCTNTTRGYANCAVVKSTAVRRTRKPTGTCDKTIITKVCKSANINMKLTTAMNQKIMCATPCAKYLVAHMVPCSAAITTDAIKTPETEMYLANVDKYCSPRRGKGARRSGKGARRSGNKGKGSGKGSRTTRGH